MDSAKPEQDQQIRCASCGQITPSYEIVNYGSMEHGYREICLQCLNAEMAEAMGLEGFEHASSNRWGSLIARAKSTNSTFAPICSGRGSLSMPSSFVTD